MALTDDTRVATAQCALASGIAFLRRKADHGMAETELSDWHRTVRRQVVANWLGELDALLHALLDATGGAPTGAMHRSERHTANKLDRVCPDGGEFRARLLSMGRVRAAYRYTGGIVRRADRRGGASLTLAWNAPGHAPSRLPLGAPLALGGAELHAICDLYAALARHLARPGLLPPGYAQSGVQVDNPPLPGRYLNVPLASTLPPARAVQR